MPLINAPEYLLGDWPLFNAFDVKYTKMFFASPSFLPSSFSTRDQQNPLSIFLPYPFPVENYLYQVGVKLGVFLQKNFMCARRSRTLEVSCARQRLTMPSIFSCLL